MGGKSGGGSSNQITGYKYFFSILMGLCRGPLDEVVQIKVGDIVAWTGSLTGTQNGSIDSPNLFGGDDKEGGIQGSFTYLAGEKTQIPQDGPAGAGIVFEANPNDGDTVTINGEVFQFTMAGGVDTSDVDAGNPLGALLNSLEGGGSTG